MKPSRKRPWPSPAGPFTSRAKDRLELAYANSLTAAYLDTLRLCNLMLAIGADELVLGSAGWIADEQPATARIRKVFVHPDLTGRGIGTRLVIDAAARATAAGFTALSVRSTLNAVPLYRKLGYRDVALIPVTETGKNRLTLMRKAKPSVGSLV